MLIFAPCSISNTAPKIQKRHEKDEFCILKR